MTTGVDHEATRAEVLTALARFAEATDTRDWDTLRAMLTPDAHAYGATGPDAVCARMQAHLGGVGPTQHLLGNHRVEPAVDGGTDALRVLSYGRVHHVGAGPMAGHSYECMGEYDDTWVHRGANWLLARRSFDIRISIGDFAVLRPAD